MMEVRVVEVPQVGTTMDSRMEEQTVIRKTQPQCLVGSLMVASRLHHHAMLHHGSL